MGHTHLNLEVELGYSHLLSNMEIASSTLVYAYDIEGSMQGICLKVIVPIGE